MTTRHLIGLAAAALWLTSCQSNTYHIKGTAESLPDGQTVYLSANPGTLTPLDSAVITQGAFRFDGETDSTCAAIIYAKHNTRQSIDFLLTPGSADIVLSATPGLSRISGSTVHDEWQAMTDQLAIHSNRLRKLVKASSSLTDSGQVALLTEARQIESEMKACIANTAQRNSHNALGHFIATHFTDSMP